MMSGPALGLSDLLSMGEAVVPEEGSSDPFPPFRGTSPRPDGMNAVVAHDREGDSDAGVASFHEAAAAHGFPASLLTDNGAVFTAAPRGGRCAIESETAALGIRYVHSRPYHPQTCGKVERFHQTLKRWLGKREPAATLDELQAQLDRFRACYNDVRPHRAIGRRTPTEAFTARPKSVPILPRLEAPMQFRVRRDKVDIAGVITLA